MKASNLLALALLLGAAPGCYWSSPPTHPHRHVDLDPAKLTALEVPQPTARRSPKLVILGRFETTAPQPVGGLYDHDDYSITPLYRTYFFRDAHLEVFEHTCDALRATGLDVRKDYATAAAPTLLEARTRARDPLLVTGSISALQHDQVRLSGEPPVDVEIARLTIRVLVRDPSGAARYDREHTVEGKVAAGDGRDMLRLLGLNLGDRLARDADFARAVGAS
jgi:hypothetical protein